MNREDLVSQLNTLRKKEKKIRQKLEEIDYEDRLTDAKQYEGKYYQEFSEYDKESIRCIFVYATDKERCEPMTLCVSYFPNNETEWFGIDYYSQFHPKKWHDDTEKWNEITQEEYMNHYEQVQKRISMAVNKKANV